MLPKGALQDKVNGRQPGRQRAGVGRAVASPKETGSTSKGAPGDPVRQGSSPEHLLINGSGDLTVTHDLGIIRVWQVLTDAAQKV